MRAPGPSPLSSGLAHRRPSAGHYSACSRPFPSRSRLSRPAMTRSTGGRSRLVAEPGHPARTDPPLDAAVEQEGETAARDHGRGGVEGNQPGPPETGERELRADVRFDNKGRLPSALVDAPPVQEALACLPPRGPVASMS